MNHSIFRDRSIERMSSPEQLDDYMRVSNPGVWMALVAIVVLLVGACVWAVFGQLDTTITSAVTVQDGCATTYVRQDKIEKVKVGQSVRIGNEEYSLKSVAHTPISVTHDMGEYALSVGSLQVGEWVYEATFDTDLTDGVYEAKIVVNRVTPISFILN